MIIAALPTAPVITSHGPPSKGVEGGDLECQVAGFGLLLYGFGFGASGFGALVVQGLGFGV